MFFIPLSDDRETTRAALHIYAHVATALNRVHGVAHPKWWHVSLQPRPGALAADAIPLPGGGALEPRLDLLRHELVLETGDGEVASWALGDGVSGIEMGNRVIAAAAGLGLSGDVDKSKFDSSEPTDYDPEQARALLAAMTNAHTVFSRHRVSLEGPVSPVQLWPHNFDMSMEWFGTRTETYDGVKSPAQLNLGFYPRGRAYFYSNPWPFDESLVGAELPHGAEWHTEGWQGTILYYDQLAGDPDAERKLADYAAAVHAIAAPTLTT